MGRAPVGQRHLILAMCVHAAKVSQASGKGAGQVSQVFKCVVVSPDNISCAWPRVCTGWCCRTPCHLSQSCETGDGGDSQQIIQTIPTSTSATLIMILTMHRSEDLMRDVHGERHDVAGAPPRGPCTRKQTSSKVGFLNFHTKRVLPPCSERFTIRIRGVAVMLRPPTKS